MSYTLTGGQSVIRDEDGARIPFDTANTDYLVYLEWLSEGNTPNPYAPPPPAIPQEVPMWAVRTVLHNDGLFDQAQTLINASTDVGLKNVWEYGNFAMRQSPAINQLAADLGLTSTQVDQLFVDAYNLVV